MSPAPAVGSVAAELYDDLLPLAYADEGEGWPLLTLAGALGGMLQEVDDLARDTSDGPGWSALLDVDRCPLKALPWLAQFVGVTLTPGGSEAQWRQEIRDHDNFNRGTPALIVKTVAARLSGAKTVTLRERDYSPYRLSVITYAAQTPGATSDTYETVYDDEATYQRLLFDVDTYEDEFVRSLGVDPVTLRELGATYAGLPAQLLPPTDGNKVKPGGLVLWYRVLDGQDYWEVWSDHCTYEAVYDGYASYQALWVETPVPHPCPPTRLHWLNDYQAVYDGEADYQAVYDDFETY